MIKENNEPTFGGFEPPKEFEWEIGKTATSIAFVNDAERFLETCRDKEKIELLREAIQQIKEGKLILEHWFTPEEYINQRNI